MDYPKTIKEYPGSLIGLAEQLSQLDYRELEKFIRYLERCIYNDAVKDSGNGRRNLAGKLMQVSEFLGRTATRMTEVVEICEPYMED